MVKDIIPPEEQGVVLGDDFVCGVLGHDPSPNPRCVGKVEHAHRPFWRYLRWISPVIEGWTEQLTALHMEKAPGTPPNS